MELALLDFVNEAICAVTECDYRNKFTERDRTGVCRRWTQA